MALIKCKECGSEVSNKAKNCPKCGADVPKKTSFVTWLVLVFIIFITWTYIQSPQPSSKKSAAVDSTSERAQDNNSTSSVPAWYTSSRNDEMTGKRSFFAVSPNALPLRKMSFPYHDVEAWIGVGCNSNSEWVYIGFNTQPNLTNDELEDGYSIINTRIKWDDEIKNVTLIQEWGAKSLHFRNELSNINQLSISKRALLELKWHGEESTFFNFSLNGSSSAIEEIRQNCRSL